jgi:hypothetical protein
MSQTFGRIGELATAHQAMLRADALAHSHLSRDGLRPTQHSRVRRSLAALVAADRYRVLSFTKPAAAPASPAQPSA